MKFTNILAELRRSGWSDAEIKPLTDLEQRLKDAEEVIAFYAEAAATGNEYFAGDNVTDKRARDYQKKYET